MADPHILQCQALQLSDDERCKAEATNTNNLFCQFHAKQVYGLYKGYKRRNAQLDTFDDDAPSYLKNSQIPLANETFESITDEAELQQVHSHLFKKYVLLSKVIDARRLHHKHFYSLSMDYGHQAYLDGLSSQRHTVLRALGPLEKRTAKVLYEKEQWFTWVRQVQDEEDSVREKEQRKIKQETALFKRNMKHLQARLDRLRQKEDEKRQYAYLEDAYRERISMSTDDSEDGGEWDPIDNLEHDRRYRYIDLIKHFLWVETLDLKEMNSSPGRTDGKTEDLSYTEGPTATTKKPKKKAKSKAKNPVSTSNSSSADHGISGSTGQARLLAMKEVKHADPNINIQEPDKKNVETEEELRKRLAEGVKKDFDDTAGFRIVGTLENPHATQDMTAPMTDVEIESITKDIKEIKLLMFSRLVLAQAPLLPAALRAGSVLEFLNDSEVTESDLRDLCLKVEEPPLQIVRDACADFSRGDAVEEDDIEEETDDDEETLDAILDHHQYAHLHTDTWLYNKFIAKAKKKSSKKSSKKQSKASSQKRKKTRVTVCGKSIWNHASEKAMSRNGWLQFSVLAKGCSLESATQLCRNWTEFSDLNLLNRWQYFPASNWSSWSSNRLIQQLQQMEFFPYFIDLDAERHSRHHQVGGRSQARRQHDMVETRNVIAGHMKRRDPVTRRFLQYLTMRTGELLLLVRDGKTGRVITAPPDDHLWTYRAKQGIGRASKNEWTNLLEVGPEYFKMTEALRKWRLGFDDFYDIYIWDFAPGQPSMATYNLVVFELQMAWRITEPRDIYTHTAPLLQTLTREEPSMRTRTIKAGENVPSLWDTIRDERNEFILFSIDGQSVETKKSTELSGKPYMFYNAATAAEDEILFPDELTDAKKQVSFRVIRNGAQRLDGAILPSAVQMLSREFDAQNGHGKDVLHDDEDVPYNPVWSLPYIWESSILQIHLAGPKGEKRQLLRRTGLHVSHKTPSLEMRAEYSDQMETMERERSGLFKESLHQGDLMPGSADNYHQVENVLNLMLGHDNIGPTDWAWFVAELMDWLHVRGDYEDYSPDPAAPWPHTFIIHDMVRAFAAMAMFFPQLEITSQVTKFLNSKSMEQFRDTDLFDPHKRRAVRPDRRTRTSHRYRNSEFWKPWESFMATKEYYADVFPMDWSIAMRPIIAKLYRAGVIAPAYLQNNSEIIPGIAATNAEPHRPGKLDLFINYEGQNRHFSPTFPSTYVAPDKWPVLLPQAQKYAAAQKGACFALLRIWSAPHYYPLMVGLQNRQATSFLDSAGRSWEWKFVPKDMPGSEYSIHHVTKARLDILQAQFGTRVVNRGDLILVMGEDPKDLMKTCTAVTFAIQTKPWLREIDLWNSFINVDVEFLQELDDFWLD